MAESLYNFLNHSPGLVEWLALAAVLMVPIVVVHELGHAVVAWYFRADVMTVHAGGAGPGITKTVAGTEIRVRAFDRPWKFDGFVTIDPRGVPAVGLAAMALAGPVASLALGAAAALLLNGRDTTSVVDAALWTVAFTSIGAGVVSLVPMRLVDSLQPLRPRFESDGLLALRALGMSAGRRSPSAGSESGHMGRIGWWAVMLLGLALLGLLALAPNATDVGSGVLIFGSIALVGAIGLARSAG